MPVGAAIGISALVGAGASLYASNKQSQAASSALGMQRGIYAQNSANLMPWIETGQTAGLALDKFNTDPNAAYQAFLNSPTYKAATAGFNFGQRGIENSAAAQGGLVSGGALRELEQFRSNYGTRAFGDYFSQLKDISGQGLQAGAALAGTGPSYGSQMGNTTMALGAANASGPVGAANAFTGALQNYMLWQKLQQGNTGMPKASSYAPTNYNMSALGPMGYSPEME